MVEQSINFPDGSRPFSVFVQSQNDLLHSLEVLKLKIPSPVIVLVGGADNIEVTYMPSIHRANRVIARIAEELQAIIIDGGTNSGVMASIGKARTDQGYKFPLIGVAVESLVFFTGKNESLPNNKDHIGAQLEPNHTNFIFVPGCYWGDESPWISKSATLLSGDNPSITVLLNGGDISRKDVEISLEVNRAVIAVKGTGRLADELASRSKIPNLIRIVAAQDDMGLSENLLAHLRTPE